MRILVDTVTSTGAGLVVVTHDPGVARTCERTITMRDGLVAFATGVLLTVIGGWQAFEARGGDPTYAWLARIVTVMLVAPVLTLGGAGLLRGWPSPGAMRGWWRSGWPGATTGQLATMAVAEGAVQAFAGAILGIGLYLGALPSVTLLHFQGRALAWSELMLGTGTLALVVVVVVGLAVLSAVFGLAKVAITPHGVSSRVTPRALSWLRLAVAVVAFLGYLIIFKLPGAGMVTILVLFAASFGVLSLIGRHRRGHLVDHDRPGWDCTDVGQSGRPGHVRRRHCGVTADRDGGGAAQPADGQDSGDGWGP